jgi:plastocyanin
VKKAMRIAVVAVGVVAVGLAVACGGGSSGSSTPAPRAVVPAGPIEVAMHDNYFEPTEIEIPRNQTVEIVAKNEGIAIHNLHIISLAEEGKDFISDPIVNPGSESRFEVRFTKAGTYKFQCDFHLPDMVGTITVR